MNLYRLLSALVSVFLLTSCALQGVEENIVESRVSAEDLIAQSAPPTPSRPLLVNHEGPYLATRRIAHASAPWQTEFVEIKASGLPFEMCLAKALEQLSAPPSVVLGAGVAEVETVVTLDHRGPFREFLNSLAAASGFDWEETANTLHWQAEVTRTFEIHRVPGELSFSMGTAQQDDTQVLQASGSGSANVRASPEAGGSIDLRVSAGFWDSLEQTLTNLLGEGRPMIDRATGTVLVQGPAGRVRDVARHIAALNAWLGRQVLLEIQIVTVTLSEDRSTGIDWELVRKAASVTPVGSSQFAELSARALGVSPASVGIEVGVPFGSEEASELEGTSVILRALALQGETSVRNTPRIVALNGQAAQLQVLSDRGYLAGVDVVTRETAALATEVQLEAGAVATGISLTILPKIVGDKVFLHANVAVSDLVALDTAGDRGITIQLPTVERQQFFQSARLRSGETLALGGLSADRGETRDQSIGRFAWLGAKTREYSRSETVLLITPTLLDPPTPDEDLL